MGSGAGACMGGAGTGAAAGPVSDDIGTVKIAWHPGHLTFFPAVLSGALAFFPHW